MKKYIAEFIGTFTLVFFGTGVAVITKGSIVETSLAFGLAICVMSYTIGSISGCHINPAVSFAMLISKKISVKDFFYYVLFQVLGAILASALLYLILSTTSSSTGNLGANYYGSMSSLNISLLGAIITEVILTFVFVYAILSVINNKDYNSISGLIIGLALVIVHLLGIKLTGTSVNPARSLAPAIFSGIKALKQVWVFILAPLLGASLSAFVYAILNDVKS